MSPATNIPIISGNTSKILIENEKRADLLSKEE
jgi:hypothetical protein